MTDDFGMSVDDFHIEKPRGYTPERRFPEPLPRANLILVRDHLEAAMRAGLNTEAWRHVVNAIKELER